MGMHAPITDGDTALPLHTTGNLGLGSRGLFYYVATSSYLVYRKLHDED